MQPYLTLPYLTSPHLTSPHLTLPNLNILLFAFSQSGVNDFARGNSQDWSDKVYIGDCAGMTLDQTFLPPRIIFSLETMRLDYFFNSDAIQVSFLKFFFGLPHLASLIFSFTFNLIAWKLLTFIQYLAPGFEPTTFWS